MLAHFALQLLAGIAVMLCVMPRAQVASGFFRVLMLLCLGLSVVLALSSPESRIAAIAIAGASFAGSAVWMLERRAAGTAILYVIGLAAVVELVRSNAIREPAGSRAMWLLSDLASAGTLGGLLTGMLLGHRYLTAPGMPLRPLLAMNGALGAAVMLRLGVSAAGILTGGLPTSSGTAMLWLALRWFAGIAGPAVVVILVWRILKYRNTQAATGVLFAGLILGFIGELSAALLAHQIGRPL